MYYEEAQVKTYYRKSGKNKKPYNQINLGVTSEFENEENVIVLREDIFNKIKEELESENTNQEELTQLQETIKKLEEENDKLKEEIENTDDLPKIIDLQEKHNLQITDLNEKLHDLNFRLNNEKDFSKALLVAMNDLNKRNFFDRLRNKEPESVKIVTELKALETKENTDSEE
jgi:septal ring factor EnvC (AmiA/AmiB activator)